MHSRRTWQLVAATLNVCSLVQRCTQPLRMTASSKVMCLKIVGNMIVAGLDNGRVQVFKVTVNISHRSAWELTGNNCKLPRGLCMQHTSLGACLPVLESVLHSHSTWHQCGPSAATSRTDPSQPSMPTSSILWWGPLRRAIQSCTGDYRWVWHWGWSTYRDQGTRTEFHLHLLQDFLPAKGSPLYSNNQCLSGMGGNILSFQVCVHVHCGARPASSFRTTPIPSPPPHPPSPASQ